MEFTFHPYIWVKGFFVVFYFSKLKLNIIYHKEEYKMGTNLITIVTFIFYLCMMLGIGMYFYKRTNNLSDFLLGGRSLNSWVASMSASASDMSGWLLMGLPGSAYAVGLGSSWIAIGLAIGTYLNWKFVAKRFRQYSEIAGNSLTLSDYFENRFRDNSKILRMLSAVFILVFFLVYTASGFVAGAKLFNSVFGIPYILSLILGIVVIIGYTFLGGFNAVSWTDLIQGFLMFFAITLVPIIAVFKLGGFSNTINLIENTNPNLLNIFTDVTGERIKLISILSLSAWGLGYFGQPHILVRFMAIKSSSAVKQGRIIASTWTFISLTAALLIGTIGIVFLKDPLIGAEGETVFMVMVNSIFHPVISAIFLSAILAAVMSTADSQLLVTSSSFTRDFYSVVLKKNASEKELLLVSRLAIVAISIVAFIIALNPENKVLDLVEYAWGGLGASFGPIVLISIYWSRMTRNGAIAGMLTGGLTIIIWKQLHGGIFEVYELLPAFILASLAIVIVSLIDKKPSQDIINEFNSVKTSNI